MRRRFLRKTRREPRAYPRWICKWRLTKLLREKLKPARPIQVNSYGSGVELAAAPELKPTVVAIHLDEQKLTGGAAAAQCNLAPIIPVLDLEG